jgi:hypothetical protein
MKTLFAIALVGLLATVNRSVPPAPRIAGAWRAVEVTMTAPIAQTIEPGPNLAVFSATHYSRVLVAGLQAPLDDPRVATADELRATWGPFVGEAGTYAMSGQLITLRPIAAKNPAAVDKAIVFSYRWADRGTLLLTTVSDRNGIVAHPETIKLLRVE